MLSTVLAVIVALPLFWVMYHPSAVMVLLGQMGFSVIVGLFSGTQSTLMIESTPSRIRCTAVGLGHNACFAVIGGLTPLVAAWLVERTADEFAPAYLIMAAAAVPFFRALRMKGKLTAPLPCFYDFACFGSHFVGGGEAAPICIKAAVRCGGHDLSV